MDGHLGKEAAVVEVTGDTVGGVQGVEEHLEPHPGGGGR